jgi:hypothetical protein
VNGVYVILFIEYMDKPEKPQVLYDEDMPGKCPFSYECKYTTHIAIPR